MTNFEKASKKIKLDSRSKYLRKLVLECLFGGEEVTWAQRCL